MKLDKKRRREYKTNYHKRLILLKGDFLRLVVRKTNRYVILQVVESKNAQDKILHAVNTKELLKLGWPEKNMGSLKSLTAVYLAGLLLGKKSKDLQKKIILDSGLIPNTKGSKVYAAVKGMADSGIDIKYDEKVLPSNEKIEGKNCKLEKETFDKIRGAI